MYKHSYSIKALAYMCGLTIPQLAEKAEIKPQRLYDVSAGRSKLKGAELLKLAKVSGVPSDQINA